MHTKAENLTASSGPMSTLMDRRRLMGRLVVAGFSMPAIASILTDSASAQDLPAFTLVSPNDGATIDTNDVLVQVDVSNFNIDGAQSGYADQEGTGQILAFIDGATVAQLTNIYCTTSFVIPMNGLTAGEHQLAVVLASNTHVPNMDSAQIVTINYEPAQPLPLPVANYNGDVGVTLVSPLDGAVVPPVFDVQVQPVNFTPRTELEGKTNVPGYGHYHVWVDTAEMPSSLAGLVLMPGTNAFTLDMTAWGLGEHQIRIEPAQNDHTMYDPSNSVTLTVTVAETAATPSATSTGAATAVASPEAVTVEMTDQMRFSPDTVTVAVGQTVTWVNSSSLPHSSTDDTSANPVEAQFPEYSQLPDGAEAWNSDILQPGESFSHTFTVAGEYSYFCIPHVLSGMLGTVNVVAG